MRYVKQLGLVVIAAVLAGCGGSPSGGTASKNPLNPFKNVSTATSSTSNSTPPVATTQESSFELSLTTDLTKPSALTELPQVDANDGTVVLTAKVTKKGDTIALDPSTNTPLPSGAPVANQAVSFKVLAGPATIGFSTSTTDSNGSAIAILTTGNALFTTNVIIEASTTINGQPYRDYCQFQIVRGNGTINMANDQEMSYTIPASYPAGAPFHILHQFSFLVTDSNGNPRVGVPVHLSVHSAIPSYTPVFLDYTTATTGSDGKGWFNTAITLTAPGPGGVNSASIIFKTQTHDQIPLINYKGSTYSVKQEKE